jgi:hypothetical protein
MNKSAQIAIEFLLLVAIAFAVVIIMLIVLLSISENNTKTESYYNMVDLGNSLQQEFLLAAELEDGYTRKINLPLTLNGLTYNVTIGNGTNSHYYLDISYKATDLFYLIPPVNGTLKLGDNVLIKDNDTLRIIQ